MDDAQGTTHATASAPSHQTIRTSLSREDVNVFLRRHGLSRDHSARVFNMVNTSSPNSVMSVYGVVHFFA